VLTRLDHLVILVRDLELASADYGRIGFAVTPGGEHADGLTRNALVPFRDGTYLELVSFLDPEDPTDNVWGWRRFYPLEGPIDYCAASDDLDADAERLASLGFGVDGPDDGGRRLPDGTNIRWRSARIRQEGRILPFLIEDLTPREQRVPPRNFRTGRGERGELARRAGRRLPSRTAGLLHAAARRRTGRRRAGTGAFCRRAGRRGAGGFAGARSRRHPRGRSPTAL
jgi:hypothetical protein